MDAGKVIREHREAVDLTQEEVAVALNVSFGAVSQWETGRTHPRRAVALRLDSLLGAGGRVAAALGYVTPTPPADPDAALRTQFDVALTALGAELQLLQDRADRTDARLAELAARIDNAPPPRVQRAAKPAR